MMGMHQKQTELWVEPVNLARRIPEEHILRKFNRTLDLSFVREEVSKTYGRNGNVSVDPVVIMKMMLLLFLDNVSSERELMRIIPLRIDYLWYLGYGLEDEIPNHSVLSKARRRWGAFIFERLFKVTVVKCLKAGLIDGSKVHVDSSNIRANASKNSIVEAACEEVIGRLDEASTETAQVPKEKGRGRVNRTKRSTTDPDATLVRQGNGQSEPSYKNHRVVDDKAGVVTALKSTTGSVNEAHELVELTEAHEANTGCAAKVVVADCKYGIAENFVALGERKVKTHMGDLRSRLNNHRLEGIFDSSVFQYDPSNDTYICPASERLYPRNFDQRRGITEYITRRAVCAKCSLRLQCTRSRSGRTVNRHEKQEILDRARQQSSSPAAVEDRKRRQHFQERNFADAANHHGFKRSRWRRLARQTMQDNLVAALQNLRLLVRRCAKGGFVPFEGLHALIMAMLTMQRRDMSRLLHPPICIA